jgi:hypothetical protein
MVSSGESIVRLIDRQLLNFRDHLIDLGTLKRKCLARSLFQRIANRRWHLHLDLRTIGQVDRGERTENAGIENSRNCLGHYKSIRCPALNRPP